MSATVWKHIEKRINSAIKGKCYAFRNPTQPKPPYSVFSIRSGEPVNTKDSPVQDIVILEVRTYDINHEHMIVNAEAIRTNFDWYSGTSEGTTIKNSRLIEWVIPEVTEPERGNVIFEAIYTYEIRLQL